MNKVGVKAVFDSRIVNEDTGDLYCIFITVDFLERIAIKGEFCKEGIEIGDFVRLDFTSIPYFSAAGKPSAFLGCKVVSKCL